MAAPTCPIAKGPSNPGDRIRAHGGQKRLPPPVRTSPAPLTRRSSSSTSLSGGTGEPDSSPATHRLGRLARPLRRASELALPGAGPAARDERRGRTLRLRGPVPDRGDRRLDAGTRRRTDPQPARLPSPGDRQPAQDAAAQRAPPSRDLLRRAHRDGGQQRRRRHRRDRRPAAVGQRGGRAARGRRDRHAHPAPRRAAGPARGGVAEIVTHTLLTVERGAGPVWAMRSLGGRPREGVVSALGIPHRQYARLFERANTAINRKLLAYLAGDWCAGYAPKFPRLAANRATPAEAREAREHLDACPSCRTAYETFTRLQPSGA